MPVPSGAVSNHEFFGELALNGDLRRVPGVLPAALRSAECKKPLFVPADNLDEARLARVEVYGANSLLEVTAHLQGSAMIEAACSPREIQAITGRSTMMIEHNARKCERH